MQMFQLLRLHWSRDHLPQHCPGFSNIIPALHPKFWGEITLFAPF